MKKRILSFITSLAILLTIFACYQIEVKADNPTPAKGEYNIDVESSSSMFRVVEAVLSINEGEMTAVLTLSGTGYSKLFMGTGEEALLATEADYIYFVEDEDGMYTYEIPVSALDTGIDVAAFSISKEKWYDRVLTFDSDTLVLLEGVYDIDVTSSSSMFRIVEAVLKSKDGEMTAILTLSGTGYSKLFMGTGEQALLATEADYIYFIADGEGMYTYEIPVSALDLGIDVAAFSISKEKWYDRVLTFESSTLTKLFSPGDSIFNGGEEDKIKVGKSMLAFLSNKQVTLENQCGKVVFNGEAIDGFIAGASGNVYFEMKNLKDEDEYKDSDYDAVIELNLYDDAGNPLFSESGSGSATVTVPYEADVPDGYSVKVYYIGTSGNEEVEAVYDKENKTITFTVEHFSEYAIQMESNIVEGEVSPKTGESNLIVIFGIGICAVILGAYSFVAIKRRRRHEI